MFSLYKNIISGNIYKNENEWPSNMINTVYEIVTSLHFKLFLLPTLPHISLPKNGHDTILCPYPNIYIEGHILLKNMLSDNNPNLDGIEHRGCFISFHTKDIAHKVLELFPKDEIASKAKMLNKTQYIMRMLLFSFDSSNKAVFIPIDIVFFITKDGDIIDCHQDGNTKESQKYTNSWIDWVLSFVRFINLPNIKIDNKEISNKTQKFFKRQKTNQTYYHILTVEKPTYTKPKSQNQKSTTKGISMPLHQVRGHLADYTEGKGLFGKYKIRLWMPDHWRGDLQYGAIKKDYKLKQKINSEKKG